MCECRTNSVKHLPSCVASFPETASETEVDLTLLDGLSRDDGHVGVSSQGASPVFQKRNRLRPHLHLPVMSFRTMWFSVGEVWVKEPVFSPRGTVLLPELLEQWQTFCRAAAEALARTERRHFPPSLETGRRHGLLLQPLKSLR